MLKNDQKCRNSGWNRALKSVHRITIIRVRIAQLSFRWQKIACRDMNICSMCSWAQEEDQKQLTVLLVFLRRLRVKYLWIARGAAQGESSESSRGIFRRNRGENAAAKSTWRLLKCMPQLMTIPLKLASKNRPRTPIFFSRPRQEKDAMEMRGNGFFSADIFSSG